MHDQPPSTQGSPSRTTAPEPKDSSSAKPSLPLHLEERVASLACPKHGHQQVQQFKVFADWPEPTCPVCESEREALRLAEEEARSAVEEKAHRDRLIKRRLQHSGVPPRFEDRTFGQYLAADRSAATALTTCREYAERFPDHVRTGTSLILCGNAGTGKTHLACAIANHVIRQHTRAAVYMTAGHAFRKVKDTYRKSSNDSEQDALTGFAMPDLLVLDEIGVQYGSDTERKILFEIVNERYEQLKPTVLISNLALPALTEFAGERVIDRMRENGGRLVVFDWKSHRGAA